MKRFMSLLVAVVMVIGGTSTAHAYTGVQSWFDTEIEEADNQWRIIPSSFDEKDFSENMTRAEFMEVLYRAYRNLYLDLPEGIPENVFPDTNEIEVNLFYHLGIVGGYPDGTFKPDNTITRQEMFKMLYEFLVLYKGDYDIDGELKSKILDQFSDQELIADWVSDATTAMRYEGIVKGDSNAKVNPLGITSRAEGVVMVKRMLESTEPEKVVMGDETSDDGLAVDDGAMDELTTAEETTAISDDDYNPNDPLNQLGYNSAKEEYVYGDGSRFTSASQAEANMVTITVDVWKLASDGSKYASTANITCNKSIAERVKMVFDEIFAGDEQFPIYTVHSYAWRNSSTSEHNQGLAIDLNYNENYMIRNGSIVAGSYWKPGEDPYSILPDGDVVNAFNKYGFAWGGNYWRSANDYMHFSYFGR